MPRSQQANVILHQMQGRSNEKETGQGEGMINVQRRPIAKLSLPGQKKKKEPSRDSWREHC